MQITYKKPKYPTCVLLFPMKSYICLNQYPTMLKRFFLFLWISISILATSCITNKDVVYLQDKDGTANTETILNEITKPYRVQIGDILSINVKALDKELVDIFNPVESASGGSGGGGLYFSGFTVDLHGNIDFRTGVYHRRN